MMLRLFALIISTLTVIWLIYIDNALYAAIEAAFVGMIIMSYLRDWIEEG